MWPRRPKETRANKTRSTVIKRGKKGGPLFFPFFWVRKELQKTRQSIEHETTFVVQKLSASPDKKQRKIISEIIGILLLDLRLFSFLRLAAGNPFQSWTLFFYYSHYRQKEDCLSILHLPNFTPTFSYYLSLLLFHKPVENQAHYYGSSNYTTGKCLNPIFHTSSFYSLIDSCYCFHTIHFLSARIYRRARCSGFRSYFLLVKIVTI